MTTTSLYGNINWTYFVYGTYSIVTFILAVYAYFSFKIRSQSLKSLKEEGFLEESKEGVSHETQI
jgi:hypothetical protein